MREKHKILINIFFALFFLNTLVCCDPQEEGSKKRTSKTVQLEVWAHAGQESAWRLLLDDDIAEARTAGARTTTYAPAAESSARNHALASRQSPFTVRSDTPSTTAV